MQVLKTVFPLLLAGSTLPLHAGEPRQHGAHEHGVGKLDIAQEGSELHIELDSPAANIVGFEHAPNSEEDHETLERALARLKDGAALFALPGAAGCRLVSADAHTPLVDHKEGEAHHDDEHHEGHEPHAKHEQRHEESHEHEETHSDITAAWRFSCAHPEALDEVSVQLFKAFPMTERLQVQFITGKHQGAAELSASQPAVRF